MKIYNTYIMTVSTVLLLGTVIMTAMHVNSLATYYTVYAAAALTITELFIYLNSQARHNLNIISVMLFAGFLVALSLQIVKILT
ncbi:MAG: hypothetical protein PHR43_01030 [Dehalococcoidales bacterium]|nr:hypothetical protein [Dehalococcoidales bacterium]